MAPSTDILATMSGRRIGSYASVCRAVMWGASFGYRAAVAARGVMFDMNLRSASPLGKPTISVGNITTGGTGKTPMVIELARRMLAMGERPAVLLRGYGKRGGATSDEEALYRQVKGLEVMADPCRRCGAARVLASSPGVSVFLLDDGFQHRQAHRDLDLVLIDATNPLGFGYMLPRGLLREPASALRRADATIVTRADQVTPDRLREVEQLVTRHAGRPPTATAAHSWAGFVDAEGATLPIDALRERRVAAVCAIGNPDAFRAMLTKHVREVASMNVFPDHHPFTLAELRTVIDTAAKVSAEALVMTEKDWVKWRTLSEHGAAIQGVPGVLRPRLEMRFLTGGEVIDALLARVVHRAGG